MMDFKNLIMNGYVISFESGSFHVKKNSTSINPLVLDKEKFDNFEELIKFCEEDLNKPIILDWSVIVRYDKGLGVEYLNMPDVQAIDLISAELLAKELVYEILESSFVKQIRVKAKI